MLDQIREIIAKNLPMEIGNQLKQHLDDAQVWKRDRDAQGVMIEKLRKELDEVKAERDRRTTELHQHVALAVREKTVTDRELRLELTLAQERQKMADSRLEEIRALVGQVFRNQELVTRRSGSVPLPTGGTTFRQDEERKTAE